MPLARVIHFTVSDQPITRPVTKFGGQPVWRDAPQWPLSRSTGNPMRFIGQIALDDALGPQASGRMAYIFMTDEEEYVDGTWEPDGGENAVVIQPDGAAPAVATVPQATGPTLFDMVDIPGQPRLVPVARQYAVSLAPREEPAFAPAAQREDWSDQNFETYATALEGNKVGGTPIFLQYDEFPDDGEWRLLLQLDSTAVPFSVNFGDAGVAYVFVDPAGRTAKLLWQCA